MSKLIFNPKKDMKELEKYGYKRLGGTEEEHYHWGYYSKIIERVFFPDLEIMIFFRGSSKGKISVDYTDKAKIYYDLNFYPRPKLKKKFIKDLLKANLIISDEELKDDR